MPAVSAGATAGGASRPARRKNKSRDVVVEFGFILLFIIMS